MSNRRLVPLNVVALPALPVGGHRPGDLVYNETDGNLYISDGASWTNLGGGSDGPYSSAAFTTDFSAQTTDALTEGTSNLYFTNQRAIDATAGTYDPSGSAAAAQAAAQAYSDSLSANYDPAGAASAAQAAAESYADTAASAAVSGLVDAAPATLDTLNELAAALGDDPNFASTIAGQIGSKANITDLDSHEASTTNVHGIADVSALETQTGAQAKADSAQSSAEAYADGLAVNYDPAGSASAAQSAAQSYADSLSVNYDPAGSAATAQSAAQVYADNLASNYDPAGSAAAAEASANTYTDQAIAGFDALPDQTGHSGEFLTTDGTTTSWTPVSSTSTQFDVRYYPPDNPTVGTCYFDRSLNTPVWWDGTVWWHPGMAVLVSGGGASTTYLDTLDGGSSGSTYSTNLAVIDGGSSTGQ